MRTFIVLLLIAVCYIDNAISQNYCDSSLCPAGAVNIGCNNNGAFASTCSANRKLINLSSLQATIIQKHNTFRNRIAGGTVSPYKTAVRMGTMTWSAELAKMAAFNARRCKFAHDSCRNTPTFKHSGQNLFMKSGKTAPTAKDTINTALNAWFAEHSNADMSVINSFRNTAETSGHFTVMMIDNNVRVGCALSNFVNNGAQAMYLVCNYASNNMKDGTIYVSGSKASQCTTGTNPNFPNLCSVQEVFNVNA